MLKALEPARRARDRVTRYLAVGLWLLAVARRHARAPLVAVPLLALSALGLQITAIGLVVKFLGHVSPDGSLAPEFQSQLARWGGAPTLAVAIIGLLALSGLATYGAGRGAITAHRNASQGLSSDIVETVRALPGAYEKWRLLQTIDDRHLLRALAVEVNKCGMSLRILLMSLINVPFLLAGLGFFLWVSPKLFLGLLGVVAVGGLIAYPLNVRAVGYANAFERSQKGRRELLSRAIDEALAPDTGGSFASVKTEMLASEAGFVHMLTNRFLVVESFRLILAILFALIVGGVLGAVAIGAGSMLFDVQKLLLLFVAFRYTYQGLQGLLLSATTLNRFLPAMQRLETFFRTAERLAERPKPEREGRKPAGAVAGRTPFTFRIGAPRSPTAGGTLERGRVHVVLERANVTPDILYRLLDAIEADHARFARAYTEGLVSPTEGGDAGSVPGASPSAAGVREPAETWVTSVLAKARPDLDAARRDALTALLTAIDHHSTCSRELLVVTHPALLELPGAALSAVAERFPAHALLAVCAWNEACRQGGGEGWVLVGNGSAIAFAARAEAMTEADWSRARAVYDRAVERSQTGGGDLDELLMEE
jgi:ABC-type multidrug transport system fused ATPase/permease subunit